MKVIKAIKTKLTVQPFTAIQVLWLECGHYDMREGHTEQSHDIKCWHCDQAFGGVDEATVSTANNEL